VVAAFSSFRSSVQASPSEVLPPFSIKELRHHRLEAMGLTQIGLGLFIATTTAKRVAVLLTFPAIVMSDSKMPLGILADAFLQRGN
jgi:hypothetical protein